MTIEYELISARPGDGHLANWGNPLAIILTFKDEDGNMFEGTVAIEGWGAVGNDK